ncbi:polysaccharide biosynthesis protein [Sphingomonas sp. SM33]|uniref:Polysaccharide biosynthesis protein n=1 Tax=Sphingomonas telluris TaxID=2907998 RepID=A0ABS9VLM7_9SPHN|nr:polysaccharide biosynthesis protein [Sphingomonas telluris]
MRKRAILVGYDGAAMAVSLWGAFSARLGIPYVPQSAKLILAACVSFAIGIFALYRLQVYHIVLRYFDLRTVTRIFSGAAIAAIAWVILVYLMQERILISGLPSFVPRSVAFIYCGFLFLMLFMGRYVMALLLSGAARVPPPSPHARFNIVIYGANAAGISLANSVRMTPQYRLVAFVDDDPALRGQILAGLPIHASYELPQISRAERISEVFLALSSASRSQRLAAINRVTGLNLKAKTIPAPEEIVSGRFTVSDVRPIDVSDLLRRDPVEPIGELIRDAIQDHTILVTGAGGSIGAEICRQVLQGGPRKLVLLDHSEFTLYAIDQSLGEMLDKLPRDTRPDIVPVVGSMLNEALIRSLLREHDVDCIYHAAAYKHVPLLERNEVVGVENNVLGTLILVRAAFEAKLTRFTMISTDKAVRPKSVMGASKRTAELIVQAYADHPACETAFGIVRFGNVLDSSGSVVQRFRKQIAQGGPVTVTHQEITRYFMSIPEATQLVLQASAMARDGEVFVLDMGEPVRIDELARNMVQLSGMSVRDENNPAGDIEIQYVGLRPGEKLYEELFVGEDTLETTHPRIHMAKERFVSLQDLQPHLDELREAIGSGHAGTVRRKLRELIDPEDEIERVAEGVVTPFTRRGTNA